MDGNPQKPSIFLLVGILVIVALLVAGYFYFRGDVRTADQQAEDATENVLDSAASGALPDLGGDNPVEGLDTVNPAEEANPFNKTYQNPFE